MNRIDRILQLPTKAREAAANVANALAILSLCTSGDFLLGAFAATCGGCQGGKMASRCGLRVVTAAA